MNLCPNGHEMTPENTDPSFGGERCIACRKRMCRKGLHEMTPENTLKRADGKRPCRACVNASASARNERTGRSRDERAVIQGELTPDWCDPVRVERALKGIPAPDGRKDRPLTAREQAEVARISAEGGAATFSAVAVMLGIRGTRAKRMMATAGSEE